MFAEEVLLNNEPYLQPSSIFDWHTFFVPIDEHSVIFWIMYTLDHNKQKTNHIFTILKMYIFYNDHVKIIIFGYNIQWIITSYITSLFPKTFHVPQIVYVLRVH